VSVAVTLVAVDLGLAWLERAKQETTAVPAGPQGDSLIIPDEWKERPAQIPGAARAYYWHGKLHVYNQDYFRAIGDYARDDDKRRIVVLGDSLTYVLASLAEDTYAAVRVPLEKDRPGTSMSTTCVPNAQSEGCRSRSDEVAANPQTRARHLRNLPERLPAFSRGAVRKQHGLANPTARRGQEAV
jgi:hypothetical protein